MNFIIHKIKKYASKEVLDFIEGATLVSSAPVAEGEYMLWDEQFTYEEITLHKFVKGDERLQVWETRGPGTSEYYFSLEPPKEALRELLLRRPLQGVCGVLEVALTDEEWTDFDLGSVKDCLLYRSVIESLPFGYEIIHELVFEGENLREWPSLRARLSAYRRSAEACQMMRGFGGDASGAIMNAPEICRPLLREKARISMMPLGPERLNAIIEDDEENLFLNTRQLAELCGVSRTTVAEWRRGEREVPPSCWRLIEARWKGIL